MAGVFVMAKKNRRRKPQPPAEEALSDDAAWEIVLNDHPEYREDYEDDTLPEEIVGENGEPMSPRLHMMMHVIVEKQLAADDPPGVAQIARQLAAAGVSRHEIRHVIAGEVAEQLWLMQSKGVLFDAETYLSHLRDVVDSYR
jgi:hypothetical protein